MSKIKLSELPVGQNAKIVEIEEGNSKFSFMELGLNEGADIKVLHIAPLGDPIAIDISGTTLSFRKQDIQGVWVMLSEE